jgi:hypothetical protein
VPRRVGRNPSPAGSCAESASTGNDVRRGGPAAPKARTMSDHVEWFAGIDWASQTHQVCLIGVCGCMNPKTIPLFDQNRDHPPVPTWRPPEPCAQTQSRMPPAEPSKPARSVLDDGEHAAILVRQGRHLGAPSWQGYRPAQQLRYIGGESFRSGWVRS